MRGEESSALFTEAKIAEQAWDEALDRLREARATTPAGLLARLDCLSESGEDDYETAIGVLRVLAERLPDIAVA